jgi:hypothetical protein
VRIPDQVRKTVAFIAYFDQLDQGIKPVGSVFFVGPDPLPGTQSTSRVFAVTARHVIEGLKSKGCKECVLRLNPVDPSQDIISIAVPLDSWQFHPHDNSVDVAVLEQAIPASVDQLVLPLSFGATPEQMAANEVDLGDEVFISGLFIHHYGARRNIPIVRTGNLAALDEEPVSTQRGPIHAYLVEARSIGGLSGSPVFLNLGQTRVIGGGLQLGSGGPTFLLLGLIHGHYKADSQEALLVEDAKEENIRASINAGIAIVVPFARIREVVEHAMRPTFYSRNALIGQWSPLDGLRK